MSTKTMLEALDRRHVLTERLTTALDRFEMTEAVAIVASFIDLDALEKMVEYQEKK